MKKELKSLKEKLKRLVNDYYISDNEEHRNSVVLSIVIWLPTFKELVSELPNTDEKKEIQKEIQKLELIAIK